jgi:hypothetical protein
VTARPRGRAAAAALSLLLLGAAPAAAWPAAVMESMARDARRLLPKTLAILMHQHEKEILEASQRFPPDLAQLMAADLSAGELQPETLAALEQHAQEAVELLKRRRVREGVVRLGALLRIPADLADPALMAGDAGYPSGVTREYYAFVEESLTKIPVVLDDPPALRMQRDKLGTYWRRVHGRSRGDSGVILVEMFRNGRVVDHRTLDYRSPVFGVASLAYSRAVTSIAATWLVLWRSVGGDVTRMPEPGQRRAKEPEAGPGPGPLQERRAP